MIKEAAAILSRGNDITPIQMEMVMEEIMSGKLTTQEIVAFLSNLNKQGETADELTAAVKVMRRYVTRIKTKHKIILDTCGTGGDKKHTFNISTAASFVASGAGISVAKHGNRSVSSKSGSADVLEALGVKIDLPKAKTEQCLDETGIAFLFAQNFHPAMKYAMEARKQLAVKTIFNFLGPLSNPADATHQLVGVYDNLWAEKMAQALARLGTRHALVVCGRDNLDEISTQTETEIYEVRNGKLENQYAISPGEFGFKKSKPEDLEGGEASDNAKILLAVLNGEAGPKRDVVLFNAGAAIYAADKAPTIKDGIILARQAIDSGAALKKLELLKEYSQKS